MVCTGSWSFFSSVCRCFSPGFCARAATSPPGRNPRLRGFTPSLRRLRVRSFHGLNPEGQSARTVRCLNGLPRRSRRRHSSCRVAAGQTRGASRGARKLSRPRDDAVRGAETPMGEGSDAQDDGSYRRWSGTGRGGVVAGLAPCAQRLEPGVARRACDGRGRPRSWIGSSGRGRRHEPCGGLMRAAVVARGPTHPKSRGRLRGSLALLTRAVVGHGLRRRRFARHRAHNAAHRQPSEGEQHD
jgi:hypothetical protein